MMPISTKLEKLLARFKEEKDAMEDYSNMYSICHTRDEHTAMSILISNLLSAANCKINTFDDLKTALIDLHEAYKQYSCKHGSIFMNPCEILNWWNPEKYGFADEHDRFWNLQIITDSDFIPYKSFTEEEYHIVYDVLYNDACGSTAYDVVASYYNKYKTPIGRKVALMHWGKCFQRIINALKIYMEKALEGDVCVYIPFLDDYKQTATHTIDVFEMAKEAVTLLRGTDGNDAPLENPDDIMVIEDMETIFEEWRDRVAQEEGNDEATIIYDEMIRRGLCPNTKTTNSENKYRRYIIGIQEKSQEEVVPPSAEKQKEKKVKDKTAVLYYMLKDKLDTVLMQKVIHYACTPQKEYKGAYPNDTIYTYVSHPEKLLDKMDRIDYVKEELTKYKFDEDYIKRNLK